MSTPAFPQQTFQDLLTDVANLEVVLSTGDSLDHIKSEIDPTHIRFRDLGEQLSSTYGHLTDGTLVVESDFTGVSTVSRNGERAHIASSRV